MVDASRFGFVWWVRFVKRHFRRSPVSPERLIRSVLVYETNPPELSRGMDAATRVGPVLGRSAAMAIAFESKRPGS
jgi:hypothetical protein